MRNIINYFVVNLTILSKSHLTIVSKYGMIILYNNMKGCANMSDGQNQGFLKKFFAEFKTFISRGSVLDMAVGLVVGSAFTAIINSLVDDILMPIIGAILGGLNFKMLNVEIPWGKHPMIYFGSFISAIITFLGTAFCVFLVVKAINTVKNLRKKEEAEEKAPEVAADVALLTEIRDLLKSQNGEAAAEKFCDSCGAKIPEGNQFCQNCGKKI